MLRMANWGRGVTFKKTNLISLNPLSLLTLEGWPITGCRLQPLPLLRYERKWKQNITLLSFSSCPLAQTTAPGSVQSLSGRRTQKRSQQGNERVVVSQRSNISPFSVYLEIELQGYITASKCYPGRWVYVPTSGRKWLFCFNTASILSSRTQHTHWDINMIYQDCGMFYKLYNRLGFYGLLCL